MNILFIGDIVGRIGRKTVAKILPKLKKDQKIDLVIANAENAAHGSGITEDTIKELMKAGVNFFTNGDHSFKRLSQVETIYKNYPVIRPANFPPDVPGEGYKIIEIDKYKILIINLIGRVFMSADFDCPFRKLDDILANFTRENLSAIIVDIHAEATSEKNAIKHYADGRTSAVFGTHTHVMTADSEITEKGTAYMTDVGMVGAANQCIGVDKENIIKTFLTQIKYQHVIPETGEAIFSSALIKIDPKNGQAKSIKPIIKQINIK